MCHLFAGPGAGVGANTEVVIFETSPLHQALTFSLVFLFAMATDAEDLTPLPSSSFVTTSSEPHPPAPPDPDMTFSPPSACTVGVEAEVADVEEEEVVGAWGRPISRFGFHRVRRRHATHYACY